MPKISCSSRTSRLFLPIELFESLTSGRFSLHTHFLTTAVNSQEQVFEKGLERVDFLNYLVDAIESSAKRTDKMMTGYWLSISTYILKALRTEFGYNPAARTKNAISEFATRLQEAIGSIFEQLLTSLYTVRIVQLTTDQHDSRFSCCRNLLLC